MKDAINKMIEEVKNPMLSETEQKMMAIQAAFKILNAADFELVVEEDGSMAVFSSDGDIVLDSKEYIRYDEY